MQDGKVKRKVGRPIAYSGDPFSPDLEPEQRRVILRRIANRESARRVRARRQDELDRLGQRVCPLNSTLICESFFIDASQRSNVHGRLASVLHEQAVFQETAWHACAGS